MSLSSLLFVCVEDTDCVLNVEHRKASIEWTIGRVIWFALLLFLVARCTQTRVSSIPSIVMARWVPYSLPLPCEYAVNGASGYILAMVRCPTLSRWWGWIESNLASCKHLRCQSSDGAWCSVVDAEECMDRVYSWATARGAQVCHMHVSSLSRRWCHISFDGLTSIARRGFSFKMSQKWRIMLDRLARSIQTIT